MNTATYVLMGGVALIVGLGALLVWLDHRSRRGGDGPGSHPKSG